MSELNSKELRLRRIVGLVENWREEYDGYAGTLFGCIYPMIIPETFSLQFNNDGQLIAYKYEEKPEFHRTHNTIDFDLSATLTEFKKYADEVICYPFSYYEYGVFGVNDSLPFFVSLCVDGKRSHQAMIEIITDDIDTFIETYGKCFQKKKQDDSEAEFGIATLSEGSLYTSWYNLPKKFACNIEKNYNNDLPYERICNILDDDTKADLILFYGEPGTGKSSLIKHFISKYEDKQFIFLDASILASIQPAKFVSYLTENENSVFILEDCEKILASRDNHDSIILPTILNITDGIISDILGIKLICTFNTSLSNIDKAILRKGRLSLKYEMGPLSLEKTKLHLPDATKAMTLADIYNIEEENDYSKKNTKKIGF